jgi:hypothetical protein
MIMLIFALCQQWNRLTRYHVALRSTSSASQRTYGIASPSLPVHQQAHTWECADTNLASILHALRIACKRYMTLDQYILDRTSASIIGCVWGHGHLTLRLPPAVPTGATDTVPEAMERLPSAVPTGATDTVPEAMELSLRAERSV